tara:strand:- start:8202 stop:8558 length:357 start_codon:yes stop_codon:yes gene_type:complete
MKRDKIFLYVYLLIILLVSSIPGNSMPKSWFSLGWEDKIYHIIEYSLLGVLAYRSYYRSFKRPFLIISIGGLCFGIFDEIYQSMIPGRFPNAFDVIADAIGVILGLKAYHFFNKKIND